MIGNRFNFLYETLNEVIVFFLTNLNRGYFFTTLVNPQILTSTQVASKIIKGV
ncbi:MAG: hypothetical protein ACI9OE_001464 [Mariniflexile sp.]|jgi:hypothetical protein